MKNVFFITILTLIFFSCKKAIKEKSEIVVKNEIEEIISSKKEVKQDFSILLKELPKAYIQLTEKGGEQIIFNPCDAANGGMSINDKKYELVLMEGHEATPMKMVSIEKIKGTYYFDVEVYGKSHEKGISVKPLDNNFKTAQWSIAIFGETINNTYVVADFKDEYPVVNQPCSECWDDCD